MIYKSAILLIIVTAGILAGCIDKPEQKMATPPQENTSENITVKFIENLDPIITKKDFTDFELIDHKYFVTPENRTLSLETEAYHGTGVINASEGIPEGYRLYGAGETLNTGNSFILIQYKVFDNEERLSQSMNLTVFDYIKAGFKHRLLNNISYKERIFILESNAPNRSDMNVTILLFGYDTVLGKIGVQDLKNKSLNESLKVLSLVSERLKIKTKEVTGDNPSMFGSGMEAMINHTGQEQIERDSSKRNSS